MAGLLACLGTIATLRGEESNVKGGYAVLANAPIKFVDDKDHGPWPGATIMYVGPSLAEGRKFTLSPIVEGTFVHASADNKSSIPGDFWGNKMWNSSAETVRLRESYEANLIFFGIGPQLSYQVASNVTVAVHATVNAGVADTEYKARSSQTSGPWCSTSSGTDTDTCFIWGASVGASSTYKVWKNGGLAGGVNYLSLTSPKNEIRGIGSSKLDLNNGLLFWAGAFYKF